MQKYKFAILTALAGIAVLFSASSAHASLTLKLSTNGGLTYATPSSGSLTGTTSTTATFVISGTTFIVSAASNAPLGTSTAQISQVQVDINGGSSPASFNLVVAVSDTSFTAPTGAAVLTSSLSGAVAAGAVTGSGTFNSVVDYNNNLFGGLPIGGTASGNTAATSTQTPTISSSFNNTVTAGTTATTPFAMSNEFHISNLNIGSGAIFTLNGSTTLAPVPAPEGFVLALSGTPLLGLGYWLRRRKVLPATAA
jgi:hypothetical protein